MRLKKAIYTKRKARSFISALLLCICFTSPSLAVDVTDYANISALVSGTAAGETNTATITTTLIDDFPSGTDITVNADKTINIIGHADGTIIDGSKNSSSSLFYISGGSNSKINFTNITLKNAAGSAIRGGIGTFTFNGDTNISNNTSTSGGGLVLSGTSSAVFNGSLTEFINNESNFSGTGAGSGGIYFSSSGNLNFGNESTDILTVTGNKGTRGGFLHNIATGITNFHTVSTFGGDGNLGNLSTNGGVIFMAGGTINFENSASFLSNKTESNGGSISIVPGTTSSVTLTAITTIGGAGNLGNGVTTGGGRGGAIYTSAGMFNFENNTLFQANEASGAGGALYISGSSTELNFKGDSTQFINNKASLISAGNGGAIYVSNAEINFSGTSILFEGNTVSSTSGIGGVISVHSGGFLYIDNGKITINATSTFGGATAAEGNTTVHGGVMYLSSGAEVYFNNASLFQNNKAISTNGTSAYGGGIFISNASTVLEFGDASTDTLQAYANKADTSGGFLYIDNGKITINATSTFGASGLGNSSRRGGAVFLANGSLTFNAPSVFSNNAAITQGAAVAITGSTLTFNKAATFTNNTVPGAGGGISTSGTADYVFNGSIASGTPTTVLIRHIGTGKFSADMSRYYGTYRQTAAGSSVFSGATAATFDIQAGTSEFTGTLTGTLNSTATGKITFSGLNKTISGTINNSGSGVIHFAGTGSMISGHVDNNGTLEFAANTTLSNTGKIAGTNGFMHITGGTFRNNNTAAGAVSQKNMTIDTLSSFTTEAQALSITNTIVNSGAMILTKGLNTNKINNSGQLTFQNSTNNGAVTGTENMTVSGRLTGNGQITQSGLLIVDSGHLATRGDLLKSVQTALPLPGNSPLRMEQ